MPKEINEKTFEINITNELINISKSFVWYIDYSPISPLLQKEIWKSFFENTVMFGEGLTQKQESNPETGGYDVSINCTLPDGTIGRLLFLQFKSGKHLSHCKKKESKFYPNTCKEEGTSSEHIKFSFNDAANKTQHSTLRRLANRSDINEKTVLYVFPRITSKATFYRSIGNLVYNCSFVPVKELDNQALRQKKPLFIIDGVKHNYRTSYDGKTSEVNYFYYYYYYDHSIVSDIISELICVQIERFLNLLYKNKLTKNYLLRVLESLQKNLSDFVYTEFLMDLHNQTIYANLNKYIHDAIEYLSNGNGILIAPDNHTIKISKEGLNFTIYQDNIAEEDIRNDVKKVNYKPSNFQYQIF